MLSEYPNATVSECWLVPALRAAVNQHGPTKFQSITTDDRIRRYLHPKGSHWCRLKALGCKENHAIHVSFCCICYAKNPFKDLHFRGKNCRSWRSWIQAQFCAVTAPNLTLWSFIPFNALNHPPSTSKRMRFQYVYIYNIPRQHNSLPQKQFVELLSAITVTTDQANQVPQVTSQNEVTDQQNTGTVQR
jgi:hypothetical protein